jgi:hypothetical protein
MKFTQTKLPDVILVEPEVFGDNRGFFMETWHAEKFAAGGITADFVQDNHSSSSQGILRGLHYQVTKPQGKLVRVLSGNRLISSTNALIFTNRHTKEPSAGMILILPLAGRSLMTKHQLLLQRMQTPPFLERQNIMSEE